MLENDKEILVGIEGVPCVGKSTFWNLFCEGFFQEIRTRSSKVQKGELKAEGISKLFTRKIPLEFFESKKIFIVDLPGHSLFDKYKEELRRTFSGGILMVNPLKICQNDYLIFNWYYQNNIPLIILANTYEKEEVNLEKIFNLFPEYIPPYSKNTDLFSYLEWSSKVNKNWSRLLRYLYKTLTVRVLDKRIITEGIDQQERKPIILYLTSTIERKEALKEALNQDVLSTTILKKETLRRNKLKLLLADKKLSRTEILMLRKESPKTKIISEVDFFKLIFLSTEFLKKPSGEKPKNILVVEIIKRYSEKKEFSLLGLKVLSGELVVGMRLYQKNDSKHYLLKSLELENLALEKVGKNTNAGALVSGQTKESGKYLFGDFITSKKIEGNYSDDELYWINYCGKEIKN